MKIKKGDTVHILRGKDRGKQGKVISVLPRDGRLVVEGANMLTRHAKPKRRGEKGQRVEVAAPLAVSNVAIVCSKCSKATRVGYDREESGKKFRICKKCNKAIA